VIEHAIARFRVAQKIDQGNMVGLRARQRPHDELEISGGKPRPTIRLDHRKLVMSTGCANGKRVLSNEALRRKGWDYPKLRLALELERRF
jgi:hypothetical protein